MRFIIYRLMLLTSENSPRLEILPKNLWFSQTRNNTRFNCLERSYRWLLMKRDAESRVVHSTIQPENLYTIYSYIQLLNTPYT